MEGEKNRFSVLCFEQVNRLDSMMRQEVNIVGRGNFPQIRVQLMDFVKKVRENLMSSHVLVKDIRLNGGAASYVVHDAPHTDNYNDIDLIFNVHSLATHVELQKVKIAVLEALRTFLPDDVNRRRLSDCSLKEGYVQKLVKVSTDTDRWSLVSLAQTDGGRNIEIKFVDSMKRSYEFSVDSFQIVLDSLLAFSEVQPPTVTEHFYPTVVAESMFGDFQEAYKHLEEKLISTKFPEEIRGGGLLKYCHLLVEKYDPASDIDQQSLERYMCSRFFIDFPDVDQQAVKLESYLINHLKSEDLFARHEFFSVLHWVIDNSTICLMKHERRQTLSLIEQYMASIQLEYDGRFLACQILQADTGLIVDQVFYGPFQMPDLKNAVTYTFTSPSTSSSSTPCLSPSPNVMYACPNLAAYS